MLINIGEALKVTLMKWACILAVILPGFAFSGVASDTTALPVTAELQKRIEHVLNRAGVSFGGEFRAGYFGSEIFSKSINNKGRKKESDGFGAVDLDLQARPNDAVSCLLILRLHHNWENFFSDPGNPVFSRWISIDGNPGGHLPFHLCDFTARCTPLTLAIPEVDIPYEPELFARLRKNAMKEFFIDEDRRPLQGLNAGINGAFGPFDRVAVSLFATRLRSIEVEGLSAVNTFEAAPDFSTWFFGTDLDTRFFKNCTIGGAFLQIADIKAQSNLPDSIASVTARKTRIADVRGGYSFTPHMKTTDGNIRIFGESAFSFDDTAWYEGRTLRQDAIFGSAAYGGIAASFDPFTGVRLSTDIRYIRNKSEFRNELAQSPGFIGRRIMNIEADSLNGEVFIPNHYSTFDALYHQVFKFCPGKKTNLWYKAPYVKSSYSSNVYSQRELDSISGYMLDPAVQLIMPFGPATPDRQGVVMECAGAWTDAGIEAQFLFSSLTGERLPAWRPAGDQPFRLLKIGGGLSFDVAALLRRLPYPCVLSGSVVRESRTGATDDVSDVVNDFVNGGCSWKFCKWITFAAGAQNIVTRFNAAVRVRQTHTSVGLVWAPARGADVFLTCGNITVESVGDLASENGPYRYCKGTYRQFITEVSMRAVF